MKKLLVFAILCLPAAAYCQELSRADLNAPPGIGAGGESASETVQRPDAQGIMADLSTSLRLSSKQEQRISSAIKKKASEFDKLMKEYAKTSEEEKKWRFKANEAHYGMLKINRSLPETVREYLDDEQREAFDAMIAAKRKPAVKQAAPPAPKPAVRKKRLVKRKKARPAAAPADDGAGKAAQKKTPALKKTATPAAEEEDAEDFDAGSYYP
jgi:hypothetical protein